MSFLKKPIASADFAIAGTALRAGRQPSRGDLALAFLRARMPAEKFESAFGAAAGLSSDAETEVVGGYDDSGEYPDTDPSRLSEEAIIDRIDNPAKVGFSRS